MDLLRRAIADLSDLLSEQARCTNRYQRMWVAEQVMEYLLTDNGPYLMRPNVRFAQTVKHKITDLLGQSPSPHLAFVMGRVWQKYEMSDMHGG